MRPKLFCDNEHDINHPILIGSTEVKCVSKIKFLGVLIDEKLSWEAHVNSLTKKLASCTGSINQIAESIPKNYHMNLYHTLFERYITYGITVWGSMPDSKLNKLFNAQKNIMRVLFGDREKFLINLGLVLRLDHIVGGGGGGGVNLILPHSGSQKRQNWDEVK